MAASLNNKSLNTSLQEQLDRITQNTRALVQPERLAFSERMIAELFATGIEDRALRPGDTAPSFTLQDGHTGRNVSSADLLALGPLVLTFFRGRWDPYCVTELEAWRDLHSEIRNRNALFIAISPQTTRQNAFAIDQHGLHFPMLADPGCTIASQYGLAHSVSAEQRLYFQSILVNIPFNNAGLSYQTATEESWRLPIPATYLIRPDSTIAFAEAHADHRVRTEPTEVLAALARL